jgi:hypothetical protein
MSPGPTSYVSSSTRTSARAGVVEEDLVDAVPVERDRVELLDDHGHVGAVVGDDGPGRVRPPVVRIAGVGHGLEL